jgi:hypothetical protein
MAVFSDSLDVEKALQIQAMCDEQGMAGEFFSMPWSMAHCQHHSGSERF